MADDNTEVLLEEQLEVEIVDDTPEKDKGRKALAKDVPDPNEDELEQYSEGVKKRISEITHKMHDERRAKEQVLREQNELLNHAKQILEENKRLKESMQAAGDTNIEERVGRLKAERGGLAGALKAAHEAGDTDKIVEISSKMAELAADEKLAASFKRQTPLQPDKPVVPSPQPVQAVPANTNAPDPRAVRWMRDNSWFGQNEEMTARAYEIHYGLVQTGVDPRNEDYYEQLNARLKKSFPDEFGGKETTTTKTVVASVSRTPAKSQKRVTLTASQVSIAKKLGVSLEDYAKQLLKEQANG